VKVEIVDPHASSSEMKQEYGVSLKSKASNDYDAVIVAVNHKEYQHLSESDFKKMLRDGKGVFVDVKGIYKGKINDLDYWSL